MIHDPRNWLGLVPETLQASPLYTALWTGLKDDPELLPLLNLIEKDQPLPITFFTAVNFLVLAEPDHPFALYYPVLHPEEHPPLDKAYLLFREFVSDHLEELKTLLPSARLQTNEVTRCANILYAFVLAYQQGGNKPLNMIEIGSSAGLQLHWPAYYYQYSSSFFEQDCSLGDLASPVQVCCVLEGSDLPSLPDMLPPVARVQGIELVKRDVFSEPDMRWVRAAIWPEEQQRYTLLDAAITFAQQHPSLVHEGDACELLPDLLAAIPEEHTAVVWHSYALQQGPVWVKQRIEHQLRQASRRRSIFCVSLEFHGRSGPMLELFQYEEGALSAYTHLASCTVHGERMTWLLSH